MSQTFVLKIRARMALLLLAGFAGVSTVQAQTIEQKAAVCKACHLTGTLQSTSVTPNIWGQNEGYVYNQLRDFKSGARNAPEDAAMRGFAATMSAADMLEMAKYASTQPWPKVAPISTDTALLKKGANVLAVLPCGGCHFNDWKGFSANPRIGDQGTAYLAATFRHCVRSTKATSTQLRHTSTQHTNHSPQSTAARTKEVQRPAMAHTLAKPNLQGGRNSSHRQANLSTIPLRAHAPHASSPSHARSS
jgi:cytochrome c553